VLLFGKPCICGQLVRQQDMYVTQLKCQHLAAPHVDIDVDFMMCVSQFHMRWRCLHLYYKNEAQFS